jgi:hypothetical protein
VLLRLLGELTARLGQQQAEGLVQQHQFTFQVGGASGAAHA